jgi:hypothetical protein
MKLFGKCEPNLRPVPPKVKEPAQETEGKQISFEI